VRLCRFQTTVKHRDEPHIEVGEGIAVPEPKMGWTLLGPLGKQSESYEIMVGLIGDSNSIDNAKDFLERLNVVTYGKDKSFLHVDFPGLGRFRIRLTIKWTAEIDAQSIKEKMQKTSSLSERVELSALMIKEKIKALVSREPTPDILIFAYPELIDQYCIQGAIGHRGVPKKTKLEKYIESMRAKHIPLDSFLGLKPPEKVYRPVDLRSVLKSFCGEHNIPIQIIRPSTLEPYDPAKPKREDDATTFWNLIVALFFKANHLPWRVKDLLEDTCYMGISFFRDRGDSSYVKTALAQVFALDSEGFVLKGEKAMVDDYTKSTHISKGEATRLVKRAIDSYSGNNDGELPKRVVVHQTSRFNHDEVAGFKEGAADISKLALVAFGDRDIKLLRWGQQPAVRGTMVKLPDGSALLYTFGYIPYLSVYPGPRVPSPLEILECHGESMETVCREILALTKMNWNNAKYCTKSPMTIGFARRVGTILRESPPDSKVAEKLKHYM